MAVMGQSRDILGLIITGYNTPAQSVIRRQLHSNILHAEILETRKGLWNSYPGKTT